jgi:trans-aconitate 2-methyltransferase
MTHSWDPDRYLTYADERGRPFVELLARIAAVHPRQVVDLGCGPGNLTTLLADRWPDAAVHGLDSSPEMIAKARATDDRIAFDVADLRDWAAARATSAASAYPKVDVLVSNATLQWVPGHLELLPDLVARVAPGGWFAFQVPGNHGEASHVLLRDLAADPRFASHTEGVAQPLSHDPQVYAERLLDLGLEVDAWETKYLHLLTGEDPVFTWISGTGARPVLQALPEDLRETFVGEYKTLLRDAYPPGRHGTVLPFRRVFAVARVTGAERR